MLAYATGANLEHLAALYGVERLVTDPGSPTAVPPVAPTMETDAALRARVAAVAGVFE
jgi:phage-related baseplate assembly protein